MKRIIILAMLMSAMTLLADAIKIGYVNSDKIFQDYEEVQNAQKIFNEEQAQWQQEYQQKKKEIEDLEEEYANSSIRAEERGKISFD